MAPGQPEASLHSRQASSSRLPRKPQTTQTSRAAELGRAADQRVPRDQNGRGSMHSRHDPQNPGSWLDQGTRVTRALRSLHTQRSSFLRGYPLPRGSLEPYAAHGGSRVGAASTQPHQHAGPPSAATRLISRYERSIRRVQALYGHVPVRLEYYSTRSWCRLSHVSSTVENLLEIRYRGEAGE